MKTLLLICSVILLISLASLPLGFYTLLRILITIGAVAAIIVEINKGINVWVIVFGFIAFIFNPLIPVHLGDKDIGCPSI